MKSNDCSNQRLFGGLQIWRGLRSRIEKYPRLRTGQAVHRSGPRGGGPLARQRRRVGGGAEAGDSGRWGAPQRSGRRGVRPEQDRDRAPTHRLKPGAGSRRGWPGRPTAAPPPLGDFRPVEPRRYFVGPGHLRVGARAGAGTQLKGYLTTVTLTPGPCTPVCSKRA